MKRRELGRPKRWVSFSTKGSGFLITHLCGLSLFLLALSFSPRLALKSELLQSSVLFCKASVVNKVLESVRASPSTYGELQGREKATDQYTHVEIAHSVH